MSDRLSLVSNEKTLVIVGMKAKSVAENVIILEVGYADVSLLRGAFSVPNRAFRAPNFESDIGASQLDLDKLVDRLWSQVRSGSHYNEYHRLSAQLSATERPRRFKMDSSLTRDEIILLAKAFKEAVKFTREQDDFCTMTGYFLEEAYDLQRELDEVLGVPYW